MQDDGLGNRSPTVVGHPHQVATVVYAGSSEIRMGCDGWGFMEGGYGNGQSVILPRSTVGTEFSSGLGCIAGVFVALLERNSTVAGVESRPVSPPQKDQQVQNIFFSEQRRGSSI